jgi:Zn-dependent metalloprotease
MNNSNRQIYFQSKIILTSIFVLFFIPGFAISPKNNSYFISPVPAKGISESSSISWLKNSVLFLKDYENVVLLNVLHDQRGFTHYRYQQLCNNIPVEDAIVTVHCFGGNVVSVSGEKRVLQNISPVVKKDSSLFVRRAIQLLKLNSSKVKAESVSQVFLSVESRNIICWKIRLFSANPLIHEDVYLSGDGNKLIGSRSLVRHFDVPGATVTYYSGLRYITCDSVSPGYFRLYESGRGGGIHTRTMNNSYDTLDATEVVCPASFTF